MTGRANALSRATALAFLLLLAFAMRTTAAPTATTTVSGRILDTQGGLPVPDATVELVRGGVHIATGRTDAAGNFRVPGISPGTYVVLVNANGYQATRLSPDLLVSPEAPEVSFQIAINRARQGLKQIGYVVAGGRTSLQTTATISTH
ncbi:MAG: carboxypeptidase-like regulatory domain-containing protein, partial [Candidatus Cybelea sp.]